MIKTKTMILTVEEKKKPLKCLKTKGEKPTAEIVR